MAKFFLKKGNGEGRTMHSQAVGIVWISIILILIIALAIFIPHRRDQGHINGVRDTLGNTILAQKEQQTYQKRHNNRTTNKLPKQQNNKTTLYDSVRPATRQPLMVELNEADTTTLQLLHGIGPVKARRIVEYRERLGGFRDVSQLLEVYGISAKLLSDMAPHLTIDTTAIRKIDINSIPLKRLIKHPYIEYHQARDIIRLRNRGQQFCSADDLRAVPTMADTTMQRLLPYITFDTAGGVLLY